MCVMQFQVTIAIAKARHNVCRHSLTALFPLLHQPHSQESIFLHLLARVMVSTLTLPRVFFTDFFVNTVNLTLSGVVVD